ncbi:MAG: PilZ domain-containing protein [Candidatus Aminicenantes bacterium]|nr:PilZ domain-containing protein [Candidatus Aminicenantes bacterium]
MAEKEIERRLCQRFSLPGAMVSYRRQGFLHKARGFDEDFCPVLDFNRDGIRFLTQRLMKFRSQVAVEISVPGERVPFDLRGRVRWSSQNAGTVYKYQTGIQFNSWGEGEEKNYPGNLVKIIALEQKSTGRNAFDEAAQQGKLSF